MERKAMTNGHREDVCVIKYDVIRNLTSQSEKENGVQTWFANVGAHRNYRYRDEGQP